MPGILYVVATPIGNLEDVTFRALRVLREVAVIAAEDTRRTARLLQHYSISTPTTSLHEHNEQARLPALLRRLEAGESIALVSDAGTPTVSDPGAALVAAAHNAGIRVEPIPGPSAAVAAVSASGLTADEILFLGFPPSRSAPRKAWLKRLNAEERLIVCYEAPHRIEAFLRDVLEILGDRRAAVGRELTKVHETLVVGPISQHLREVSPKGEFTVVIAPDQAIHQPRALPDSAGLRREFGQMTGEGGSRRAAIRELAARYKRPAREVYQLLEKDGDE